MISSTQKAKLTWHCRRGMLELDLILQKFLAERLDDMSAGQLSAFENLLNEADPDLYSWLMGYATPTDKELAEIVTTIRFIYTH